MAAKTFLILSLYEKLQTTTFLYRRISKKIILDTAFQYENNLMRTQDTVLASAF